MLTGKLDVLVVGAGAAGVGMAVALARLPGLRYGVLEAGDVGESFRRWPRQTRFITPSFHSNAFGLADLNAVTEYSSPAIFSGTEHPSGAQYADYLSLLVARHDLPVVPRCRVQLVEALPGGGFQVRTQQGVLQTRFLIWAAGEFQFPELAPFSGAQWCHHYAQVEDWQAFRPVHQTVIGGYESGVDATVNLVRKGCEVRLLVRKQSWDPQGSYDPSLSLSPYSRERMYEALDSKRLEIVFGVDVTGVSRLRSGGFRIEAADGRQWSATQPPVLGTGFVKGGGACQIAGLWDRRTDGAIALSACDESTRAAGLFLVGPQVRQDDRIYCFIYKFRQRFGLVAAQIAERLGLDAGQLQAGAGAWGPFGNSECCEGCEC
ncbi:pyridine nucleotide-disulfide oxidoreductase [Kerstersia gyiorum]|uniref:Pyridine nucleotide-disulfide oxidoreductase n=1 Tax=Kerstersia gyiorum TaxID=206506 RepID=A0A4Q7MMH9_9BURK|nr:NAD(P)/FAD-dependent oxidoreductase [Kerstersia gyiorum]KAB0544419.1 thioredoxin reductase [Kerstersia gyiorum]RZS69546.1 pyridine nucleotide-disulfide oxidoreductase [Kerstersia gyiorum]